MVVVLALSSHVARGCVGNMAAMAALQALDIAVWPVATVMLSNHKGYPFCAGPTTEDGAIRDIVDALAKNGWLGEIDAILTGYVASPGQAEDIADTVEAVRRANPNAHYWCDPILGDDPGGLYVPEPVARAIADRLVPLADGVSPNVFELEWLTGKTIAGAADAAIAAESLGLKMVMTTSVPARAGQIANTLTQKDDSLLIAHTAHDRMPHGTGDVFSALALGNLLAPGRSGTGRAAFEKTVTSIAALVDTVTGQEELNSRSIDDAVRGSLKTLVATPI